MSLVFIFFIIILLLLWITTGGFLAQASVKLHQFRNLDDNFNTAYWKTFTAAVVTWCLVALAVILIILIMVGGFAILPEIEGLSAMASVSGAKSKLSIFLIIVLIISFCLVLFNGVYATIGAVQMKKSPKYDSSNKDMALAYRDCVISSVTSILLCAFIVIILITYIVVYYKKKSQGTVNQVTK